jgi:hypothetical protein
VLFRSGRDVGRIAVMENRPFNKYHNTRKAQFTLFETEDDQEIVSALFEHAFDWAHQRNLDTIVGPKGFGPLDGYGIQIEGFDHRQMMTMVSYNSPEVPKMLEAIGFEKEVDFVSCYVNIETFRLPERVHRIAARVQERGTLRVVRFNTKKDLVSWAGRIGKAYNETFINNWEYYPLSDREISFVVDNLLTVAVPKLFKIIVHEDQVVGFLFGFPDVSAALQRSKGRLFPIGIFDLLLELRRTRWISLNGIGILSEFQGRGGNALMYSEIEKTIRESNFIHAELTQVAETAVNMRNDLINVGAKPYKNHRVYHKKI